MTSYVPHKMMKHKLLLLLIFLGQSVHGQPHEYIHTNPAPFGASSSSNVTAIKIGESSNAFTFLNGQMNQLSVITDPLSWNSHIAFIYRQNNDRCGGQVRDNGRYRYSISIDKGLSWNVGSAGMSSAGNEPLGCYGLGELNPAYSRQSRYPNMVLSLPPGADSLGDASLVYTGPIVDASNFNWDGWVAGVATDLTNSNPSIDQEIYLDQNGDQYFSYSLVERVPGEYWTAAYSWDGSNPGNEIHLNKGVYDTLNQRVNWRRVTTLLPDYFLGVNGSPVRSEGLSIAFSPDGLTGYVAMLADLKGNQDSVLAPCFAKTTNGGLSWSDLEEFDMEKFYPHGLLDSLSQFVLALNHTTHPPDTVRVSTRATLKGGFDLAVDKNGNPHLAAVVGSGNKSVGNGNYTQDAYTLYPELGMFIFDFTKDSLGDWNMLYLGRQATYAGNFGDPFQAITSDPHIELSRSLIGDKIFFSWMESDTFGIGGTDNNHPDLMTVAFDVEDLKVTPLINRTKGDPDWDGLALLPETPPLSLFDGNSTHTLPVVVMKLRSPQSTINNPVDFYYLSDIDFQHSNFSEHAAFFYNCKLNPVVNAVSTIEPACGASNGEIQLQTSGGAGGYAYKWSNNASGDTSSIVSGLRAGIYTVLVQDDLGCGTMDTVILNNQNAPQSSANVIDASCFGLANGSVQVSLMGGTPTYTFSWSDGSSTQHLSGASAGQYQLTITDAQNCKSFLLAEVNEPEPLLVSGSKTDLVCPGDMDGRIDVVVAGGSAPYTYQWDNNATTEDLSGLEGGAYFVVVMDSKGCINNEGFVVEEPAPFTVDIVVTKENDRCTTPFLGELFGIANGGSAPYNFSWTGPDGFTNTGSSFIFGLNGGEYNLLLADSRGCQVDSTVLLPSVVGIDYNITTTNATCKGIPNGSMTVDIVGGVAPLSFLWDTGATTQNLTQLEPGFYGGRISDSQGCVVDISATVAADYVLSYNLQGQRPTCFGGMDGMIQIQSVNGTPPYNFLWSTGSTDSVLKNIDAGAYGLRISDGNGCKDSVTHTLDNPAQMNSFIFRAGQPCPLMSNGNIVVGTTGGKAPFTYLWSNGDTTSQITGLDSGRYTLITTDLNECKDTLTVDLPELDPIGVSIRGDTISCFGENTGSIILFVQSDRHPFQYDWGDGGPKLPIRSNLGAGLYSITIEDNIGCDTTVFVQIRDNLPIEVSLSSTPDNGTQNGTISSSVSGGTPPFTYMWSDGQNSQNLSNLTTGVYTLAVTDHAGCMQVDTVVVGENVSIDPDVFQNIDKLEVYPNPAKDMVTIDLQLKGAVRPIFILYDAYGKMIYEEVAHAANKVFLHELSVGGLADGIYMIAIKMEEGPVFRRLIKH